jgi:hypothetical protein
MGRENANKEDIKSHKLRCLRSDTKRPKHTANISPKFITADTEKILKRGEAMLHSQCMAGGRSAKFYKNKNLPDKNDMITVVIGWRRSSSGRTGRREECNREGARENSGAVLHEGGNGGGQ